MSLPARGNFMSHTDFTDFTEWRVAPLALVGYAADAV